MKFIKKYKTILIIVFICLLLISLAMVAIYRMFYPSNDKSVYGHRLDNAPEISNEVIAQIEDLLMETKLVNSVNYNTKVRTMKFFIDVKSDVKIQNAKDLSKNITDKLSNEILSFYDITIYLTQKDGKMVEYPAVGYKFKEDTVFKWVVNKEVKPDEK